MRGRRRRWNSWRQAYMPRLWTSLPAVIPLAFLGNNLVGRILESVPALAIAAMVVWSGLVGVALPQFRWWWWRRRHPMLTAEEWREVQCRAAIWN